MNGTDPAGTAPEEPRVAAAGEYLPDLLPPRPPTSAGVPNGAPERDPADNWAVSEPLPSFGEAPGGIKT